MSCFTLPSQVVHDANQVIGMRGLVARNHYAHVHMDVARRGVRMAADVIVWVCERLGDQVEAWILAQAGIQIEALSGE